jgi:hypothetical protein
MMRTLLWILLLLIATARADDFVWSCRSEDALQDVINTFEFCSVQQGVQTGNLDVLVLESVRDIAVAGNPAQALDLFNNQWVNEWSGVYMACLTFLPVSPPSGPTCVSVTDPVERNPADTFLNVLFLDMIVGSVLGDTSLSDLEYVEDMPPPLLFESFAYTVVKDGFRPSQVGPMIDACVDQLSSRRKLGPKGPKDPNAIEKRAVVKTLIKVTNSVTKMIKGEDEVEGTTKKEVKDHSVDIACDVIAGAEMGDLPRLASIGLLYTYTYTSAEYEVTVKAALKAVLEEGTNKVTGGRFDADLDITRSGGLTFGGFLKVIVVPNDPTVGWGISIGF